MNNLSQECIKAITVHEECYYQDYCENRNTKIRSTFMVGAIEALTNPTIYQSAGLIKAQDILPETFKTEAVNTILVNALRYLNDEQTSHLLKAICQRNTNATQSAGLMTVEEALRFAEWVDSCAYLIAPNNWGIHGKVMDGAFYTTTELLNIFRNQNQE